MNYYRLFALIVSVVLITACKPYENIMGGEPLVVVDLNAVAKALGRDEVMKQEVGAAEKQLRDQLQEIADDLKQQVRVEQQKLNTESQQEEIQRVEQLALQAQQAFKAQQIAAQQKASQYREQLLQAFRSEVKAVAEPIARQRGARLVKFVGADVLWFDPGIDITGDVISGLRAASDVAAE